MGEPGNGQGQAVTEAPLPAIDVHGHFGRYDRGAGLLVNEFMSADAGEVAARARAAGIGLSLVSPLAALLPRGQANAVAGNQAALDAVAQQPALRLYAVLHPLQPESYRQAADMLELPYVVGLKLHPEEHVYPIRDHGDTLFRFAEAHGAVVLAHTSEARSLAADFVEFANRYPGVRLILAHLGHGHDGDYTHQVRAIQESRHGNVYTDTSSARSITPRLLEWAVREVGADRILFGTDTPLYHAAMQKARVVAADLTDAEKDLILAGNARRLFRLPEA